MLKDHKNGMMIMRNDNMKKEDKERIIQELLKSTEIIDMYDTYIIKSIPFEIWVRQMADYLWKKQRKRKSKSILVQRKRRPYVHIRDNHVK